MSAVLKRLKRDTISLVPTDNENWELFGAERIWANLMGNRDRILPDEQQLLKESCESHDLFTYRNTEFLCRLRVETLQAIVRICYQTDAHHVIRKRLGRLIGAKELLENAKQAGSDRHLLTKALEEFLMANRKALPIKMTNSVGPATRIPLNPAPPGASTAQPSDTENRHGNPTGAAAQYFQRQPRFTDVMRSNCEMNRTLTIVDLTFIIFASYYAPRKDALDEERLAIFLKMFTSIVNGLRPKNLLLCLDSPSQLIKVDKFDTYKGTRRFDTRLHSHFDQVGEFLIKCGLNTLRLDGYEADDLANAVSKRWLGMNPIHQVAIITSDKDFFQICSERVWIYKYHKEGKRYMLYRPLDVVAELGVRPDQFVDYQCLVGDASDSIQGLDGVGKRTAIGMLQEHGTLLRVFQHAATIEDPVLLSQYNRVCVDNKYLLTFLNPDVGVIGEEQYRFDPDEFSKIFSKYLTTHVPPIVKAEFARRENPLGAHQAMGDHPFQ